MTRQQLRARLRELTCLIVTAESVRYDCFTCAEERAYHDEKLPGWIAERDEHERALGAMNEGSVQP